MLKQFLYPIFSIVTFFSESKKIFAQDTPFTIEFKNEKLTVVIQQKDFSKTFSLETVLPQTNQPAIVKLLSADENSISSSKTFQYFNHSCTVTNTLVKTSFGLQWDIEIIGEGEPYTVPIETVMKWDNPKSMQFWTAWSGNPLKSETGKWSDPFVTAPLQNLSMVYGGETHLSPNAFVIPVASSFIKEKNFGLSFIQSLKDTILGLQLNTSDDGKIAYTHLNHRISNGNKIHIRHFIVLHEADWRAGVKWAYENFPSYFLPKQAIANDIAGGGAYSSYEGQLNVQKYKQMGFSINWKASLDFPYMGMFIPPVKTDDQKWIRYKQRDVTVGDGLASINGLEQYSKKFKAMGFHTLSYFNVTEFGNKIIYPYQPAINNEGEAVWKNANDFLYTKMYSGLLRPSKILPDWDSRPIFSNWEDCVAMDPGDSLYQAFLMEQAKLHIQKLPSSSGICIDRLDWLRYYNGAADDGVSFADGNKTRSLILSWKSIMKKLGPLMHDNGKVIFCNPLYRRIDLMEQIDGIYDEFGNNPSSLNLCTQLALFKPIIAWTISKNDFQPNPDAYFQHHLYLGAFLTVPFPGNDHTITPDTAIEKFYLDYGEMFNAIKGRQWMLSANIINVENDIAKANVFKVKDKVMIPVIHGAANNRVNLRLNLPNDLFKKDKVVVKVLYPGESKWKKITITKWKAEIKLPVTLKRGCALVSLEDVPGK